MPEPSNPTCIFCKIIAGQAPADVVYRDERATAFQDLHPVTPVHILVVPNRHIASMNELDEASEALVGHMATVARLVAAQYGIQATGYRLVINTGLDAGQSVFHVHAHLMGGRVMAFRSQ